MIKPTGSKIIVKLRNKPSTQPRIKDPRNVNAMGAEVLAVGDEVKNINVGDRVFFEESTIQTVNIGGKAYFVVTQEEVIAYESKQQPMQPINE